MDLALQWAVLMKEGSTLQVGGSGAGERAAAICQAGFSFLVTPWLSSGTFSW